MNSAADRIFCLMMPTEIEDGILSAFIPTLMLLQAVHFIPLSKIDRRTELSMLHMRMLLYLPTCRYLDFNVTTPDWNMGHYRYVRGRCNRRHRHIF